VDPATFKSRFEGSANPAKSSAAPCRVAFCMHALEGRDASTVVPFKNSRLLVSIAWRAEDSTKAAAGAGGGSPEQQQQQHPAPAVAAPVKGMPTVNAEIWLRVVPSSAPQGLSLCTLLPSGLASEVAKEGAVPGTSETMLQVDAEAGTDLSLALRLQDALGDHFAFGPLGADGKLPEGHPLNRMHLRSVEVST
jgi:hypothetical protein